jgi:AraC-like DNA-binding protein
VLLSRRDTRCAVLGARVSTLALLHSRFRVHLVENERVVCDDALALRAFERKGQLSRAVATLVIEGRARLRVGGAERQLGPGDVALLPSKLDVEMRQEAAPRYVAIVVEWEPGVLFDARPAAFRVTSSVSLSSASEAADRLRVGDPRVVETIPTLFSEAGLVARPWQPEPDESGRFRLVSHALDRALSFLDAQPMSVDLERALGLSARQVNRVVADFNARYGFNAGTWRDARNRRRLLVGAALLTHADATVAQVARAVGYRSETALCRAFANAGLPTPGSIASARKGPVS